MGNSGSINNITTQSDEQQIHQQSWTKITNPRNDGIKVLPRDGLIGARLRSTDNGNILHAGGTLTGQKKQQQPQIQRSKSITEQNFKNHSNLISRSQTQLEIIPRPDGLNKYKNSNLILMKKIGSVPDLSNELDEKRVYIKKYQAPQLPLQQQQKLTVDYDPCRFGWKTKASSPVLDLHQPRKQRLFKTRVETTKKPIHVRKLSSDEDRLSDSVKKTKTFFQIPQFRREKSFDVSLLSKSKVVKPPSPPQQQIEIFETTKSLKKIKENSKNQQNCFQQELLAATKKRIIEPKQKVLITEKITEQLPKTFYFGMNENQENEIYQNSMNRTQLDEIDKFAESLLNKSRKKAESSESALSSDCDDIPVSTLILINENSGISLQLRPTLPKKQFDVPRFSPAAAWRQLSTTTTAATDEQSRDYENDFITPAWDETNSSEIRIERIIRRPPVLPDNKSGDSGISGDAGLPERQDSPQPNKSSADDLLLKDCENYLSAWTPQLVLGDDDDESVSEQYQPIKTSNNGHIFSLSLPREHLLTQLNQKPEKSFNSLKKLKLTVSGAFGQTTTTTTTKPIDESIRNDNWFLSRSAPNSIDNVPAINNSTSTDDEIKPQTYELQQNLIIKPNSFNYLKTGHHIMYLPNHTLDETSDYKLNDEKIEENQKIYIKRGRENLQDLPSSPKDLTSRNNKKKTGHRFTFQSTVRQIERKRLSDRLSKEAEQKEAQRLSELEAMRRVEEEFQKKRAREKATIRQQLRLYSLEENQTNLDFGVRVEPEGATLESLNDQIYQIDSKLNPTTEILSEFRTQRREYVEYRCDQQYCKTTELNSSTEYPIAHCNIPAAGDFSYAGNSDNYRRHFARGISVGSSDSELSHSSGRNRTKQAQYRQRSPSPSGLY